MCQFAFAQYESFDLSKYKLPEIKRHQLDLEINTNGSSESSNANYIDSNSSKLDIFNIDGNGNLLYSVFKNTKKLQENLNAKISSSFFKEKTDLHPGIIEDSEFNTTVKSSYEAKYFIRNKWFYLIDPYLYFNYMSQKDNDVDYTYKSSTVSPSVGLGFGKGRIEQVQDYRQAILIMNELEKRNVIKESLSEAEMLEFAEVISAIKNERFFDSRKKKEKELKVLDTFLQEKGLISQNDINYFTGLEDMWSFGALQIRENGTEWKVVFTPNYYYTDRQGGEQLYDAFNTGYGIEYKYRKPINLKWQFDSDFGLNFYYHKLLRQENISSSETKYSSNLLFNSRVGYYPNTRTYVRTYLIFVLKNSNDQKVLDSDGYATQISLGTSAYYYFSEKLRIGLDLSYGWFDNYLQGSAVSDSRRSDFQYSLNLNYAIF